jgi:UDP-2-acetamido-3-amino-2,3-dideoxy-glucuronate N-acetyltransferase
LQKGEATPVPIAPEEPLRKECEHFLECVRTRQQPLSNGINGLQVLQVLQACQTSLQLNGRPTVMADILA